MDAVNRVLAWAFCSFLFVPSASSAAEQKDFFVENAVAVTSECMDVGTRELQFSCHRIQPGEGIVIGSRIYKKSWKADGASFRKLTVSLPQTVSAGDHFSLSDGLAKVFLSRGSSAFAGKRGCYGKAEFGDVEVLSISDGAVSVRVRATISMKPPLKIPKECEQPEAVNVVIQAVPAKLDELGAWEGRPGPGDSPFSEANVR